MNEIFLFSPQKTTLSPIIISDISYSSVFNISNMDNIQDAVISSNTSLTSTLDGNPVVARYGNLTINEGCTLTVSQRCKGLYLSVFGNLVVNGTISMTARGAKCAGKYILIDKNGVVYYFDSAYDKTLYDDNFEHINAVGGIGVAGTSASSPSQSTDGGAKVGAVGVNGACGAGGNQARKGGNGSSFSGGAGAGCTRYRWAAKNLWYFGGAGANNGGQGGANGSDGNNTSCSGSGAGNPAGTAVATAYKGADGTGGLLIIFVKGNVIIGENGSIQANGSKGGNAKKSTAGEDAFRGGSGSGGGAIHLFYGGQITNSEKVTANGGAGGTGWTYYSNKYAAWNGSAGGKGTINIQQYNSLVG